MGEPPSSPLDVYVASPVIRGLIQLIPGGVGSAIDATLATSYTRLQQARLRAFFEALGRGDFVLSPDLIGSDDFLHCYFTTVRAVLRTHRDHKIHLLANLLRSAASGSITDVDAYEEYLAILEELSYRELALLTLLDRYERKSNRTPSINDAAFAGSFWSAFSNEATALLAVDSEELQAMLNRLNRSGCYETFFGTFGGLTHGRLTSVWGHLRLLAEIGTVDV